MDLTDGGPEAVSEVVPESPVHREPDTSESRARSGVRGLLPPTFSIDLPGPARIDRQRLISGARTGARLAVLSTSAPRLPLFGVGLAAAVWAAVVGMVTATVLALLSGVTESGSGLASLLWLAAHHAPVTTDVGTVSLLPLGLLLITVLPLRRAGRFVVAQLARRPVRPDGARNRLLTVAGIAVLGYAGIVGLVAASDRSDPYVAIVPAVFWALIVATAAGSWGAVRQARGGVPRPPFVVAVAVSVAVPMTLALLLTAVTLILGSGGILAMQEQVAADGTGLVGLILLQLAYLPNLVIWAGAFVIGTGLSFGTDHRLSPFSSGEPVLPDFPILAAMPTDVPNSTALLPIAVALGGVLGAVIFARLLPEPRLRRRITRAIAIALASGGVWWVLTLLSGGSLGDGRLDSVGPATGTVLIAVLLTGAGTMLWALLPTLASDAKPVAVDLRERVTTAASAAKDATNTRLPSGKRG